MVLVKYSEFSENQLAKGRDFKPVETEPVQQDFTKIERGIHQNKRFIHGNSVNVNDNTDVELEENLIILNQK